ncbi:MAG: hypothetical protein WC375_08355 [Methanomassiliicoccales archaeon]
MSTHQLNASTTASTTSLTASAAMLKSKGIDEAKVTALIPAISSKG